MSNARDMTVLVGVGAVAVLVLYFVARKGVGEVVSTAGGIVSGNNALTQGTPYEGWGIFGTLGAGVNSALGGLPQDFGEWLGGKTYDLTH